MCIFLYKKESFIDKCIIIIFSIKIYEVAFIYRMLQKKIQYNYRIL